GGKGESVRAEDQEKKEEEKTLLEIINHAGDSFRKARKLTVKVSELASRFILMTTPMKVANTIVTRRLLHFNMHTERKSEEDGREFALRSNKWFVWE
ncbi:hypothetical protein ALC57_15569, partial [Trachymyrmex cornetzi]